MSSSSQISYNEENPTRHDIKQKNNIKSHFKEIKETY